MTVSRLRGISMAGFALVGMLLPSPGFAQSLVATSGTDFAFWSSSHFYTHCANGHYWMAFHDGTQPVIYSSPDGTSWTALGDLFALSGASDYNTWAVRFSGNDVIAVRYVSGFNTRFYRNGTLNADGTITWSADGTAGPSGSSWQQLNALIANGKPLFWRAGASNGSQGRFRLGSQLSGPTWTDTTGDAPALSTATAGGFSAGAIFPIGGGDPADLIVIRATRNNSYVSGRHRLIAVKYDASLDPDPYEAAWYNVSTLGGGLTESATTEVKEATDDVAHRMFSAVRDASGNIHAVFVNRNDDVVHYEKAAGFNDNWSRVSPDVTAAAAPIDRVALAATSGDSILLYYSKSDGRIYSRVFDGTSWSSESVVKSTTTPLQGALATMEWPGSCGPNLAWVEGAAAPFNVMFSATGGACPDLSASEGAGTLTVTAPGSFEMTFNTASGGGVQEMYDLAEDPSRSHDLAGALAGAGSPTSLHTSGMDVGGTFYNAGNNDNGAQIALLEATSTRVKVRQDAFYQNPSGAVLMGVEAIGDHTIYPSGRLALRWNRRTTTNVSYNTEYHEMMIHYTSGVDPLSTWAIFNQTGGSAGDDDFLLAQNENTVTNPGAVTDFLDISYRDWTTANGYTSTADITGWTFNAGNERVNMYWVENTGAALGGSADEVWSFLTYFKPTILVDGTDPAVTTRSDDYRNPDALAMTVGSGWFDADENTSSPTDFFNESEAAYALDFDPASGLDFQIDGGTQTRYAPFFKIRQWRSLTSSPSVDFTGALTTWRAAEQTGDLSAGPSNNTVLETHRVILRAGSISQSGTEIRLKLRGDVTNPANGLSNFHIAEVDPGDDRNVVDATWTQVTFNSGSTTVNVPAGGTVWSDWIPFTLDSSKTYSVTFFLPANSFSSEWLGTGIQKYLTVGSDSSATLDWSGIAPSTSSRIDFIEEVETKGTKTLAPGVDFKADVKPVSRAHYAQDLAWYSPLQTATSVSNPDVGVGGGLGGSVLFVPGRYGGAAQFNSDGEYLFFPASEMDPAEGTIEFWYKPRYDYGSNLGSPTDDFGLFGYWIDANNYFYAYHEPYQGLGGTDEGIKFEISRAGTIFKATTGAGPSFPQYWRTNDWVHLRFVWKADPATPRLEIYINGVLASQPPTGSYSVALARDTNFYIGERERTNTFLNNAEGLIDELALYTTAMTPATLAAGGLTSNASEYLASGSRNFTFDFSAVDVFGHGKYAYFGADSEFQGLNFALATSGVGSTNLAWQYWDGSGWSSLAVTDGTNQLKASGTVYWTAPANWAPYSVNGSPDLFYVRVYASSGSYSTPPVEAFVKTDILLFQYCSDLDSDGQQFVFAVPPPTAVALSFFEASGLDGAVALRWRTASELKNLGFHLYRARSADGPFERLTETPIPGLGSSPSGAAYEYRDEGLENGTTYYYLLEDIETTGRRERHGPVDATPVPGAGVEEPAFGGSPESPPARLTYGTPEGSGLRVVKRTKRYVELELVTKGFAARPTARGSVELSIPGFDTAEEAAIPVKRVSLSAVVGRKVKLGRVRIDGVVTFSSLEPEVWSGTEIVAEANGTVRVARRVRRRFLQSSLLPRAAARLASVGFQGDEKKAVVELAPLRWDGNELLLATRLRVRVFFAGREEKELASRRGPARRRRARFHLVTKEPGIYAVRFEDVFARRRPPKSLRLSRRGVPVPYHIEPEGRGFRAGTTLYFFSEGAKANAFGDEAVYELEPGVSGPVMETVAASPVGLGLPHFWYRERFEENRYYQAGLVDAEDLWLWDLLFAPETKTYPFNVSELAPATADARIVVRLEGASDFPTIEDHHIQVSVNGTFVGEAIWNGKKDRVLEAALPPGVLREGTNELTLESAFDTEATYSMVFLDGFDVVYPRSSLSQGGGAIAEWGESGTGVVRGLDGAFVMDVTGTSRWLSGLDVATPAEVRFAAEAGRRYWVARDAHVPQLRRVPASRLLARKNRAEWLLIAPRAFLPAAKPLLRKRRRQGLKAKMVAVEDVFEAFGHGESNPEALRELIRYVYHEWRGPRLRYVVLVGDGTFDYKDYLKTGVTNRVPPLMVRTSYLWTASDPTYAAVHGDDPLPDVAIGRLPAATVEQAQAMVEKILAYEGRAPDPEGRFVLVADDPDAAGDFVANAEELSVTVLASRPQTKIYLPEVGASSMRGAIRASFDAGARLVSYIGHGGIHLWASENVFDTGDVADLTPQAEQPIVLTMNCLNGYFHFPYFDSLAEALLKAEEKGAIAAFSPTGLSLDAPAHIYHRAVLEALASGRYQRLGDAILAAQKEYADSGARPELLSLYHLFGDPALTLR